MLDISEAHLKRAVEQGSTIQRVIVVLYDATGDFLPWLRLSDRKGYLRLSKRRYEGPKTYRDFRTMRRSLAEQGYSSILCVYPVGHPHLARLGIG